MSENPVPGFVTGLKHAHLENPISLTIVTGSPKITSSKCLMFSPYGYFFLECQAENITKGLELSVVILMSYKQN